MVVHESNLGSSTLNSTSVPLLVDLCFQEVAEDAILAEAATIEAARRAEEAATRRASAAEASKSLIIVHRKA